MYTKDPYKPDYHFVIMNECNSVQHTKPNSRNRFFQ